MRGKASLTFPSLLTISWWYKQDGTLHNRFEKKLPNGNLILYKRSQDPIDDNFKPNLKASEFQKNSPKIEFLYEFGNRHGPAKLKHRSQFTVFDYNKGIAEGLPPPKENSAPIIKTITMKDSSLYQYEELNGQPHGLAKFTLASGIIILFRNENGKPLNAYTKILLDGTIIKYRQQDNKPHGPAVKILPNGTEVKFQYDQGKEKK